MKFRTKSSRDESIGSKRVGVAMLIASRRFNELRKEGLDFLPRVALDPEREKQVEDLMESVVPSEEEIVLVARELLLRDMVPFVFADALAEMLRVRDGKLAAFGPPSRKTMRLAKKLGFEIRRPRKDGSFDLGLKS